MSLHEAADSVSSSLFRISKIYEKMSVPSANIICSCPCCRRNSPTYASNVATYGKRLMEILVFNLSRRIFLTLARGYCRCTKRLPEPRLRLICVKDIHSFISLLPTNVKTHSPLHMTKTHYDYVTR